MVVTFRYLYRVSIKSKINILFEFEFGYEYIIFVYDLYRMMTSNNFVIYSP